ncbi:hypothetical protein [Spirosoma sp. KNUC1025]|uniref:hypothetical protein n=1 Tax=Spirosoma sp. KNUC1025 TaxID=2894082 RepID=UPI00386A1970|nr:hypothetical protein LN737_03820 [Spirosoma sp. KNUC1025]
MKTIRPTLTLVALGSLTILGLFSCSTKKNTDQSGTSTPSYKLIPAKKVLFNSFVDCNMAEVWVGDTFRIFPGKYGEDPLWGNAHDLKYASGQHAEEVFARKSGEFTEPTMPKNVPVGKPGLHGAVWFETVYQDTTDKSGKTLFAVYHNENYPATLPYNPKTGEGYVNKNWPQGITGPTSPAAVCRIGIMKSTNGGKAWENKGIFIEDLQAHMILKPHNTSKTFAGGVGDPSAVASGDYLYLFYGEYGYPGQYADGSYDPKKEWSGQCISVARIRLSDLDNPVGKAKRWDGKGFNAPYNGVGAPINSLQIPQTEDGGPASSPSGGFYWGPSVSWNTYLHCWVMLMGKAVGPSWAGSSIYISFNKSQDLGQALQSQEWSKPQLLLDKPGYFLWYPALQPMNTPEDIANRNTCLRLGQRARLFVKNIKPEKSEYLSEYILDFRKGNP